MTNLEAAKAAIGANTDIPDETYLVGLVSSGLDPNTDMVAGKEFDLALAALILYIITAAKRVTESQYTVEIDADALLRARRALLAKWGVEDDSIERPTLRNKSYLW